MAVPKSSNKERQKQNITVKLPTLEPSDIAKITALDRGERLFSKPDENGKVYGATMEVLGWTKTRNGSDVDEDIENTEDIWEREELTLAIVKLIEVEDEHNGEWLPSHFRWAELWKTGSAFVSDAKNSVPNSAMAFDEESGLESDHGVQPNPADIAEIKAEIEEADEMDEENGEAWEDELEENCDPQMEIQPWDVLKKQLEKVLKDHTLPCSHMNQLTVLGYFANLWLKDYCCIAAGALIATICKHGEGKWFAH
ncbi:aldo-keto reductase [Salix suchowensis]|nr:aldo-keto reductase [Salix suchowensis]